MCKSHHPDKSQNPASAQILHLCMQAYQILSDPEKRELYDKTGSIEPLAERHAFGKTAKEAFSKRFGANWGRANFPTAGPFKGMQFGSSDISIELKVLTTEFYHGAVKQITVKRTILVSPYEGKLISKNFSFLVSVRRGAKNNHRVVLKSSGNQDLTGRTGDLIVNMKEVENMGMKRMGDDLIYDCQLDLEDALCGFILDIPHPNGETLEIIRQQTTQPGSSTIIKDMGMPLYQDPETHGDLIIKHTVVLPVQTPEIDFSQCVYDTNPC